MKEQIAAVSLSRRVINVRFLQFSRGHFMDEEDEGYTRTDRPRDALTVGRNGTLVHCVSLSDAPDVVHRAADHQTRVREDTLATPDRGGDIGSDAGDRRATSKTGQTANVEGKLGGMVSPPGSQTPVL